MQNRCGYCYERGHNRRTCPSLTKSLEARAREGNSYAQDQLDMRGKGKSKSSRTCSFCQQRGHDRRTCETLSRFVDVDSAKILETRRKFAAAMTDNGLGPGALISTPERSYNYSKCEYEVKHTVSLVTNIDWDKVTHRSVTNSYDSIISSRTIGDDRTMGSRLPKDIVLAVTGSEEEEYYTRECPEVLNSVDILASPPGSYYDEKRIRLMSKNFAKDLKHYSYDVYSALNEADNGDE